jgi:hypothetical protein
MMLTRLRLTMRAAFALLRPELRASSDVCSTQKRKMQKAMASTVSRVRTLFRRRCFST